MYKERRKKKIIAIKDSDCSINSSTKKFTTAYTPKLHRAARLYTRLRQWGGGVNLVERQRQLHACTHGIGGVWVGRAQSEAENFVFLKRKFCNIYGEYKLKFRSGDELKKKVAEEEGGKHKEKTHIVLWA